MKNDYIDYIDDKVIMSGYVVPQERMYLITLYLKNQKEINVKLSAPNYAMLLQHLTSPSDIFIDDFIYIETTLGSIGIKMEELVAFTIHEVEENK